MVEEEERAHDKGSGSDANGGRRPDPPRPRRMSRQLPQPPLSIPIPSHDDHLSLLGDEAIKELMDELIAKDTNDAHLLTKEQAAALARRPSPVYVFCVL